jgi:hypothetical protein
LSSFIIFVERKPNTDKCDGKRSKLPFGASGSISFSFISIWLELLISSIGKALSVNWWYWTFSLWAIWLTNFLAWKKKNIRWKYNIWMLIVFLFTSFFVKDKPDRRRISSRSFSVK